MMKRILIANRGEIACRIARTCQKLGIDAVGIYSDADQQSRHVREIGHCIALGGSLASESYLNIEKVINAAKHSGCDAIHPGYGFLSENPEFADAVEQAGLIFIGPRADSLRRFGDKSAAKKEAISAEVSVIPGSDGKLNDPKEIAELVKSMRLPVMLKAAAGGGGKGMRVLNDLEGLDANINAAMSEALRSFSNDALIVEQCINNARHVEVQIAGDGEGNVVHLFERECSLQRRHQKVVEEAPAVFLNTNLRNALLSAACRLGRNIQYRGLGTVEFLVLGDEYYFLEVNPRLQVEHPVTECITGLDLVELQIRIANGDGFGFEQTDIQAKGHAIEVRLYAESPVQNFMPSTGVIDFISFPEKRLRIESGVDTDDEVSPYYDPMIAKLISEGDTRVQALDRLVQGLGETAVFGIDNNRVFLHQLLSKEEVRADRIDTGTLDRWLLDYSEKNDDEITQRQAAIAAAMWLMQHREVGSTNPWTRTDIFSQWALNSPHDDLVHTLCLLEAENEWKIAYLGIDANNIISLKVNDTLYSVCLKEQEKANYLVDFGDIRLPTRIIAGLEQVHVQTVSQQVSFKVIPVASDKQGESEAHDSITAPMMGEIIKVHVTEGDVVEAGQLLIVMESMKMQLQISAIHAGTVSKIYFKAGDNVARGAIVVDIDA